MGRTLLLQPDEQLKRYPLTRYMGSKRKLLDNIWEVSKDFEFESVIDLFSGSGVVSYLYKCHGKKVVACDFMHMNALISKAMIENNNTLLSKEDAIAMTIDNGCDNFVSRTFAGIYFRDEDNHQIDVLRNNIKKITDEYQRAIALEALVRACQKKRPRGIFTYTGYRYDDGRNDLKMSIYEQFLRAVDDINCAIFSNRKKNRSVCGDSLSLRGIGELVYIDPPYYNPDGDNDYVRRYHFLEGLVRDWEGVQIDYNTKTHKFPSYKSQFSTKNGTYKAFNKIFEKYKDSILVVSYSSNSLPSMDEMLSMMREYQKKVDVIPIDYRYNFANQDINKKNNVQEFLFVGRNW